MIQPQGVVESLRVLEVEQLEQAQGSDQALVLSQGQGLFQTQWSEEDQ